MALEDFSDRILEILEALTPRERDLLRLRFGLDDGICRTAEQVAVFYGWSKEHVREVEKSAFRKLRQLRKPPPSPKPPSPKPYLWRIK
jgi:RNA polymerase primary sigma factor